MSGEFLYCPDCGKRRYASRSEAKRSARQMASDAGTRAKRYRPYPCGGWWHLTSWKPARVVASFRDWERGDGKAAS